MELFSIKRLAQVAALTAAVVVASGTTASFAAGDSPEMRSNDIPTAEATIEATDADVLLVHTQSMGQHTVCADAHGTADVVVMYDENETTISPGHCALLEASQIKAHSAAQGKTHVTVHSHFGGGGHEGKTN